MRFPLLGEYQQCFSGKEFASEFNGNLDHAEIAERVLTEKYNLLRRLGELGSDFDNADDTFFQFRARAFLLDVPPAAAATRKTGPSNTAPQVLTQI